MWTVATPKKPLEKLGLVTFTIIMVVLPIAISVITRKIISAAKRKKDRHWEESRKKLLKAIPEKYINKATNGQANQSAPLVTQVGWPLKYHQYSDDVLTKIQLRKILEDTSALVNQETGKNIYELVTAKNISTVQQLTQELAAL